MLEFFKVLVQPVVLVKDEIGNIIEERPGQATSLYSQSQVADYFAAIESEIETVNKQEAGD